MSKLLIPLTFILGSVLAFVYYIMPGYQNIQELNIQKAQYDEALKKAEELVAVRDRLQTELNNILTTDRERAKRMVPEAIDVTRLIVEMDRITRKYGQGLASVRVTDDRTSSGQSGPNASPYGSVTLAFNFSNTYDGVIDFLREFENNLRITDVAAMSFTPQPEENKYVVDVTLKTYYLKPVQ